MYIWDGVDVLDSHAVPSRCTRVHWARIMRLFTSIAIYKGHRNVYTCKIYICIYIYVHYYYMYIPTAILAFLSCYLVYQAVPQEHPDEAFREEWVAALYAAQTAICSGVEALEAKAGGPQGRSKTFQSTKWERGPDQGGGLTSVLQGGAVFAKAGVNVSAVKGPMPLKAVRTMCARKQHKLQAEDLLHTPGVSSSSTAAEDGPSASSPFTFFAAGLSLVIHPENPMAPTVHMNYRFFQLFKDGISILWWFGGGTDLSPCYVIDEDCISFHGGLKEVCDRHDETYYPRFKVWCDYYFRLPHRREARGIGGIFFDDLNNGDMTQPGRIRAFCCDALNAFVSLYLPIVEKRYQTPVTGKEVHWQQIRRGRYVEFNLLYDRGTKFGISLPGSRAESILISLPVLARWEYEAVPEEGSQEALSLAIFQRPRDWVSFDRKHLQGFQIPLEEDRAPEL